MNQTIYHITLPERWQEARAAGEYAADSLLSEGFIHCSTVAQVARSLNRFYRGVSGVLLLAIDPALLRSELKYEPAHGELFPHIYGRLNLDAVTGVEPLKPDADGAYQYPA
ncbi:MAG: DUF952 domain-containing protein [Bacteroidetes bacterium]|nr:DUF952 domain-containing protein [Bacteroidota bacterium]